MVRQVEVYTDKAPRPLSDYAQGILYQPFQSLDYYVLDISGQTGATPGRNIIEGFSFLPQAEKTLKNIEAILNEVGMKYRNIHRVRILTTDDITDDTFYSRLNTIYKRFTGSTIPKSRVIAQVAGLPRRANIEISAVAHSSSVNDKYKDKLEKADEL